MANLRKPSDRRQNRVTKDITAVVTIETGAVAVSIPEPPVPIHAKARRYWEAFWRSEVCQAISPDADAFLLVRWITYVELWNHEIETIRREGTTVPGSTGQTVQHPSLKTMQWLDSAVLSIEREIGLTPKARAQLGLAVNAYKKSAADLMGDIAAMPPVSLD